MELYGRMKRSIRLRRARVFLRREFLDLGASDSQLSRVLSRLVEEGVLVKLGVGVYAKAKKSVRTGNAIPVATIDELLPEVLDKLGIAYEPGSASEDYTSGVTTQIPVNLQVRATTRTRRKIGFGNRVLTYEKH